MNQNNHSRLFFPMIEEKMNMYEYPYMTATLKEMICMLKRGGSLSTFIYPAYAIASLIIKTILEKKYKRVVVFFSGIYAHRTFIKKFQKSLRMYYIGLGNYNAIVKIETIGDDEILELNDQVLKMKSGFRCEFFNINDSKMMRGMDLPDGDIGFTITCIGNNSETFREIIVPYFTIYKSYMLLRLDIYKDDAACKRKSIGYGSLTLKLNELFLRSDLYLCDTTCRSCNKSKETWDDEIKYTNNNTPRWISVKKTRHCKDVFKRRCNNN